MLKRKYNVLSIFLINKFFVIFIYQKSNCIVIQLIFYLFLLYADEKLLLFIIIYEYT